MEKFDIYFCVSGTAVLQERRKTNSIAIGAVDTMKFVIPHFFCNKLGFNLFEFSPAPNNFFLVWIHDPLTMSKSTVMSFQGVLKMHKYLAIF